MRRLGVLAVAGLALMVAVVGVAGATPDALVRALLTTPYRGLPGGYHSAAVRPVESSRDKKYHVVGAVEVDIDGSDTQIFYEIFRGQRDAAERFTDRDWRRTAEAFGFTVVGSVPGFRLPSHWLNGSRGGRAATVMTVQRGSVIVTVITYSKKREKSGAVAGIALVRSALAHLGRVEAKVARSSG